MNCPQFFCLETGSLTEPETHQLGWLSTSFRNLPVYASLTLGLPAHTLGLQAHTH